MFAGLCPEEAAPCHLKDSMKSPLSLITGIVEIRRTHTSATQNAKQDTLHYQMFVRFRIVATGITLECYVP